MYRFFLKSLFALSGLLAVSTQGQAVEVYLFKGAGDLSFINKKLHYSRGLEGIAKQLNSEGIHAKVRRYGAVSGAISEIARRKPESVAFIGHSMGALASLGIAKRMKSMGVRVSYIGLIDIPGPVGTAGGNVEMAENYYTVFPIYGKLTNVRSHPNAKNIHVAGHIHTTIDDSKKVRNGMLAAIRQIHMAEQQLQVPVEIEQFSQPQYMANQEQPLGANDSYSQNFNQSEGMIPQSGVDQYVYNNPNADEYLRPSVEIPSDDLVFQQVDPSATASVIVTNSVGVNNSRLVKPREHYTRRESRTSGR